MPEVKEDKVVEPVTVKVPVLVVVASQVKPEMEIDVPEATPKIGVTKVGEVAKTFCPLPVLVVTKRAPLEADSTVPELKEDKVVEAVTVKVPVLVVVAKKE
jgi:hypothetical protein